MKNMTWKTLLLVPALFACSGSGDKTTWTISDVQTVGTDECEINPTAEPFVGSFDISIDGSNFTFAHTDLELEATTDDFSEQADEVTVTGTTENTEFPPCTAQLDDSFVITAEDGDKRIENNDTLTVVWNHEETDASAVAGDCAGEWFVDLPCQSQVTFTLTKN